MTQALDLVVFPNADEATAHGFNYNEWDTPPTPERWEAWPQRDRLQRWRVVRVSDQGKGKSVVAENIRSEQVAREIAALRPPPAAETAPPQGAAD